MTTNDAPPLTHYLLTITTVGQPVRGDQLAIALRDCFDSLGVAPISATSYSSPIAIHPQDVALKDAWLTMPDTDRSDLRNSFPHLVTAIELICGIRKEDYS